MYAFQAHVFSSSGLGWRPLKCKWFSWLTSRPQALSSLKTPSGKGKSRKHLARAKSIILSILFSLLANWAIHEYKNKLKKLRHFVGNNNQWLLHRNTIKKVCVPPSSWYKTREKSFCGMNNAFLLSARLTGCDIQFIWNVFESFNGV